jgi:hypothetical protein
MTNNYIRIGYLPELIMLFFDDKDPAEIERVKLEVIAVTGGRMYNLGLWKRCTGLHYPIIGESHRA